MSEIRVLESSLESLKPEAVQFLQNACDALSGYCTLELVHAQVKAGIGRIYTIYYGDEIKGASFVNWRTVDGKRQMSVILLGGDGLPIWGNTYVSFMRELGRVSGSSGITVFGRKGWGRQFPNDLREVATVFEAI